MNEIDAANQPHEPNHISTVRRHLLDQMSALRAAKTPEDMKSEIERSKGIADLAQAVVNTAKVEVEYLRATNQNSAPFLEAPPDKPYLPEASERQGLQHFPSTSPGINGVTRHRLQG